MVNRDLLVEIATMHYENGLTQGEIAKSIGVSRPYVSRLLKRAHEDGIVEVIVHRPIPVNTALQQELVRRFNLLDARVLIASSDPTQTGMLIGQLGASYLNAIVQDGMTIGVSFGDSVYQVVKAMPTRHDLKRTNVVQLIGSRQALSSETDGPIVAEVLASKLNAPFYRLHAPLLLDTPESRDSLLSSSVIARALDVTRAANIAVVGIGAWANFAPSLRRLGYQLEDQELSDLENAGVVGDVLVRCIDQAGTVIPSPINQRIVGIEPDDLKRIRWTLGVAWQVEKAQALLASMRGRYINVLITVEACAQQLLEAEA